MFGLFSKKTDDSTWFQQSRQVVDDIAKMSPILLKAGKAIEIDQIDGWTKVSDIMSSLNQYQITCKQTESNFNNIGSPQSDTYKVIQNDIKMFFYQSKWAFHWGKHHYKDASGGPGRRAKFETHEGLRKAATYRVTNNGTKFFTAALTANRLASNIVKHFEEGKTFYSANTDNANKKFVPLSSMFLAHSLEMFSLEPVTSTSVNYFRNVMNSGAWLFETGAIIGSLFVDDKLLLERFLGNQDDPGDLIEMLKTESQKQKVIYENNNHDFNSLWLFFTYMEYRNYDLKVFDNPDEHELKKANNFLKTKIDLKMATTFCGMAFLKGIGFGINYPELTKSAIKNYLNPPSVNDLEKIGLPNVDFKDLGLDSPKGILMAYEERVNYALKPLIEYVRQYFPELEKQLNYENKLSDYKT